MKISRKVNFHLRLSIANRPWKFHFEKTFRKRVWMNEEKNMQISSLCTKSFKTTTDSCEDFSIADWTDQNIRKRYSEKVKWLRIERRSNNNERQVCCSDFHKLERITRNVPFTGDNERDYIKFQYFVHTNELFRNFWTTRGADFHQVLGPHPKYSVWSNGALTDSKDIASRLIPAPAVCCLSCWSANSLLASGGSSIACSLLRVICPLPALCKNHSAFGVPEKKNCFQISEQSAETKVKPTMSTRGLIKHNLQSQNIKFTTRENIFGLRRFA